MDRRTFALGATLAPLVATLPVARANRPLSIIVGFPPGPAGFDFVARQVASQLPNTLGRQAIVENRTGASGRIALEATRTAKPDGDTVVLSSQSPMTIFPHIDPNLSFDPAKDFTPITRAVVFDYTVTVGPEVPVRTIGEYLDWLRANPDKAMFATPGNGTTPHFIGEALHQRLGVPALAVAYKGGAPSVLDVMAGRVPATYDTVSAVIEQYRAGKLRILATLGGERSPLLPEVPTLEESGVDLQIYGWCGFYGPAGLSSDTTQRLSEALGKALRVDSVKSALERIGMFPSPSSPDELRAFQQGELEMWGPIIKTSGFKL
ncbi:MAG: Bug family tripartite tricarboxylate transporter substrate binding protein [Pigmentiphaga sp.]